MRIKATDNPSLAFICFVERFAVALLSAYARVPDFVNNAYKEWQYVKDAPGGNVSITPILHDLFFYVKILYLMDNLW